MRRRVLIDFDYTSLNRVSFTRRLNLLPILPISTARQIERDYSWSSVGAKMLSAYTWLRHPNTIPRPGGIFVDPEVDSRNGLLI